MSTDPPNKIDGFTGDPPTEIEFDGGPDINLIDKTWEAVHHHHPDRIYCAGDRLVILRDGCLHDLSVNEFSPIVTRSATLAVPGAKRKNGKRGPPTCRRIPRAVISDMVHSAAHNCRPIEGIARCPFITRDHELAANPGYHAESKLWRDWHPDVGDGILGLPEAEAKAVLRRILDFPFATPADWAHALGLYLLAILRQAIPGATPMHLIAAPAGGCGKTYLARCVGAVVLGVGPEIRGLDGWSAEAARQLITNPAAQ